jgi:Tfp pilus assembly protein PilF
VHVAKGHLLMCRNEVAPAEAEFNIARSLDRNSTESCLSFFRFLCETGKSQESVRMRKSYLDTHVDDVLAHVVYGTALSVAGHLEEAEQVLKNALQMDQSCFAVHFELALFYSKQNRAAEATHHAQCLEPLVDQATFEMIQRWISNRLLHAKTTSP